MALCKVQAVLCLVESSSLEPFHALQLLMVIMGWGLVCCQSSCWAGHGEEGERGGGYSSFPPNTSHWHDTPGDRTSG